MGYRPETGGRPVGPGARRVEEALIAAARSLTARLDVAGVCAAVLDRVHDVFGATSTWILLHDPRAGALRTVAFRGPAAEAYRGVSIPDTAGIMGLAFARRQVVFVPNAQEDDRWFDPARVHGTGLLSAFAVPLVCQEKAIGVVGLDAPLFDAERPPGDADVACLEAFAAQAAIAIVNAQLYEASERDRRRLEGLLGERRSLRRHVHHLQEEIRAAYSLGEVVGESPGFKDVLRRAELVSPGDTTVLLLGETGTGKELFARLIHDRSRRARGPFVAVNCAALPEALVESELFGHEKGAFTGAIARKAGKFELADEGTLFLDEVGDLPAEAQAKLLRVLQDSQVQHVGGTHPLSVDVRVIAATNQNLESAIAAKTFRPDLFYRLSVFPLAIPPLRERREDIGLLARYFLSQLSTKLRKPVTQLSQAALEQLTAYDWPGNIRELQNILERAVILSTGTTLELAAIDLPPAAPARHPSDETNRGETLMDAERRAIRAALAASAWRISGAGGAAERLAMKPTTLHAKMKKLGIHRPAPSLSP